MPSLTPRTSLFLLLGLAPLSAQTVDYAGKVLDEAGLPVAGANLQVTGTSLTAKSAANGTFRITGPVGIVAPRAAAPRDGAARFGKAALWREAPLEFALRLDGSRADGAEAAGIYVYRLPGDGQPRRTLAKAAAAPYVLTVALETYTLVSYTQGANTAKNLELTLYKPLDPATPQYEAKRACLDTLNRCRAQLKLPPLVWSKRFERFADSGAQYDAEKNSPHAHFIAFSKTYLDPDAENEVPGWPLKDFKTTTTVVLKGTEMMWDEPSHPGGEQGHYLNIKGDQHAVGCGIYVNPAGEVWVTQDFQ